YMICEKTHNALPMQTRNMFPTAASVFPTDALEARTAKSTPSGAISAQPNPFKPDSQRLGQTILSWMTYATSEIEVRVNAPDGPVFAKTGPGRFSQETGRWIRDGTSFYLQNVSAGRALTPENTLAIVTLKSA